MTPEPAQQRHSHRPGAPTSPSTPEEHEEFWIDLGRQPSVFDAILADRNGFKVRCNPPEGMQGPMQKWTVVVCPGCEGEVMPAGCFRTRCKSCNTLYSTSDERPDDRDSAWWGRVKHRYPIPGERVVVVPFGECFCDSMG